MPRLKKAKKKEGPGLNLAGVKGGGLHVCVSVRASEPHVTSQRVEGSLFCSLFVFHKVGKGRSRLQGAFEIKDVRASGEVNSCRCASAWCTCRQRRSESLSASLQPDKKHCVSCLLDFMFFHS